MSHEPKTAVRQEITGGERSPRPQPISSRTRLGDSVENPPELGASSSIAAGGHPASAAPAAQRPQVFNFDAQGVRVVGSWDAPWFIATDVLRALGLGGDRVSEAVSTLEADEKGSGIVATLGGPQEMLTVNESGLYALIFRSRKPSARLFRRWVTTEVLPAIRQTGGYQVPADKATVMAVRDYRAKAEYWQKRCYAAQSGAKRRADAGAPVVTALPGPDSFPPAKWEKVYACIMANCRFVMGRQISSVELAEHVRGLHPEFTVRQILRALPWMMTAKFGVGRSNDLRFANGCYRRGYRHIAWLPALPALTGGAS